MNREKLRQAARGALMPLYRALPVMVGVILLISIVHTLIPKTILSSIFSGSMWDPVVAAAVRGAERHARRHSRSLPRQSRSLPLRPPRRVRDCRRGRGLLRSRGWQPDLHHHRRWTVPGRGHGLLPSPGPAAVSSPLPGAHIVQPQHRMDGGIR